MIEKALIRGNKLVLSNNTNTDVKRLQKTPLRRWKRREQIISSNRLLNKTKKKTC